MKICRFNDDRIGLVRDGQIHDVTAAVEALGPFHYPLPRYDPFIAQLATLGPEMERLARSAPVFNMDEVNLLSPVANPGKIVAAPVNYRRHLDEARGDPAIHHDNQVGEIRRVALFLKATSSMIGASQPVMLRHSDRRNDHEIELVAIIGKRADKVSATEALDYVAGYTIGLDMTVRGPEERSFRKSVDSFSVLGPWLVTADELPNPDELDLHLTVNGETRQKANTRDLVIGVAELIEFATSFYTLEPGDILFTGTPAGVGPVLPGDSMEATISGIGVLRTVVKQDAAYGAPMAKAS